MLLLAFLKYLALSDTINLGVPLLAVNLLKARKNVSVDKSVLIS